jgi:hypothetical protein
MSVSLKQFNQSSNCPKCNILHDVKCNICDSVCRSEKRDCPQHCVRTLIAIHNPGVTCNQCQERGLKWVHNFGSEPHILKNDTKYLVKDLSVKPYVWNFII